MAKSERSECCERLVSVFRVEIATVSESNVGSHDQLVWLSTKEAAKYLRKTVNALHIMVIRGHLRPRKFRNRLFFRRIELERLIESSVYE